MLYKITIGNRFDGHSIAVSIIIIISAELLALKCQSKETLLCGFRRSFVVSIRIRVSQLDPSISGQGEGITQNRGYSLPTWHWSKYIFSHTSY